MEARATAKVSALTYAMQTLSICTARLEADVALAKAEEHKQNQLAECQTQYTSSLESLQEDFEVFQRQANATLRLKLHREVAQLTVAKGTPYSKTRIRPVSGKKKKWKQWTPAMWNEWKCKSKAQMLVESWDVEAKIARAEELLRAEVRNLEVETASKKTKIRREYDADVARIKIVAAALFVRGE